MEAASIGNLRSNSNRNGFECLSRILNLIESMGSAYSLAINRNAMQKSHTANREQCQDRS